MSRDPTIQQLRCFRVLAEELHFGRAAQRLHMSQPPLSRHIRQLEENLGVSLFARASRRVELTDAGAAFLPEAEIVLGRLDRGISLARRVASGDAGELVIGYSESFGIDILPRVLSGFRQLHPKHELKLLEMHTKAQIDALRDGSIDCGFFRLPTNEVPDLTLETVWNDHLVAALPDTHPAARGTERGIALRDLRDEPFIVYEPSLGVGILASTINTCMSVGFNPGVVQSAQSTPMLLALVAAGEGVALVSRDLARVPRPGVVFRELVDCEAVSEVIMGWRRADRTEVIDNLRELVLRCTRTAEIDAS